MKHNKGFTLIELLVVIAIIGLLSSVVLASLNTARMKARDASKTAAIKEVKKALEMYYDDHNAYPTSPDVYFQSSVLTTALVPTYLASLPRVPSGSDYRYYNNNQTNAQYFAILIRYETKANCYMCSGNPCYPGIGWWGVQMCQ